MPLPQFSSIIPPISLLRLTATLTAVLAGLTGAWRAETASFVVTESGGTAVGSLAWAVEQVNGDPTGANVILLKTSVTAASQFVIRGNLLLDGGGRTVDLGNKDRAFLILSGSVTLSNLTILNAQSHGGDGADGAGGGAGLGGAVLALDGRGNSLIGVLRPTVVTLDTVTLKGNSAKGGTGGDYSDAFFQDVIGHKTSGGGGGGGLGGTGGHSGKDTESGGGGGGGIGNSANGGEGSRFHPMAAPGTGATGLFGLLGGGMGGSAPEAKAPGEPYYPGAEGGALGGGGGGGGGGETAQDQLFASGGGGGIYGQAAGDASASNDTLTASVAGAGGFGGGGGGAARVSMATSSSMSPAIGGTGGFAGGGGGSDRGGHLSTGGNGGFGGGAGAGAHALGVPGWGGGTAGVSGDGKAGSGGGGLGAGGGVFAAEGTTLILRNCTFGGSAASDLNSVIAGILANADVSTHHGAQPGLALGSDLFLETDTEFQVTSSGSFTGSLDGYRSSTPSITPVLTKTGPGTLELHGQSSLSQITLAAGTLKVGNALSLGPASSLLNVTGQSQMDTLGSGAVTLQVGQVALGGSTLTVGTDGILSPDLTLSGLVSGTAGAVWNKIGKGSLVYSPPVGKATPGFTGALSVTDGTLIVNQASNLQISHLTVTAPGVLIASDTPMAPLSVSGSGQIQIVNGASMSATDATHFTGTFQIESTTPFHLESGTGHLDLQAGGGAVIPFSNATFLGTISGNSDLQVRSGVTSLSQDPQGYSGNFQVESGAHLILPQGWTGANRITGVGPSSALSFNASISNPLSGNWGLVQVLSDQGVDVEVSLSGPIAPGTTIQTLAVGNGRFVVPSNFPWNGTTLQVSRNNFLTGTAILTSTIPGLAVGGNGILEINAGASPVVVSGLSANGSSFIGTVHTRSGTAQLVGGISGATGLQIESGATVILGGEAATTLNVSAPPTGAGTLGLAPNTTVNASGNFSGFSGSLTLPSGSTLTVPTLPAGITVNLSGGVFLPIGDLHADVRGDGYVDFFLNQLIDPTPVVDIAPGVLNHFTGLLQFSGSTFNARGGINNPGARISVNPNSILQTDGDLIGEVRGVTSPNDPEGTIRLLGSGNRSLGTADADCFASMTLDIGQTHATLSSSGPIIPASVLLAAGAEMRSLPSLVVVRLLTATGAATIHGSVVNNGDIEGPTTKGDYLVFDGTVTGGGRFAGNIKGAGVHSPGTELSPDPRSRYALIPVNGTMVLDPSHRLDLDLGGFNPGQTMDTVVVSGTLTLGGTLRLRLAPGFTPQLNDTFEILRAGSLEGAFSAYDVTRAALGEGLAWDFSEVGASGKIRVTAAPSALSVIRDGDGVVLEWEGTDSLQSAPVLLGPWVLVDGASSPYRSPTDDAERYFRLVP